LDKIANKELTGSCSIPYSEILMAHTCLHRISRLVVSIFSVLAFWIVPQARTAESDTSASRQEWKLTPAVASNFARIALRCVSREYPNKPDHVFNDENDLLSPKAMHPSFYGCFDWHSSVHGHWMLVRILRLFPDLPESGQIRAALGSNLTADNIQKEVQYLDQPGRKSFERTYGWAWLLKLAEELLTWNDKQGLEWSRNLDPLVQAIVGRYMDFLPKQTYPIRTGVHPNTAFGISFALDYARAAKNQRLEQVLVERSMTYYAADKDAPLSWEPGGEDFFSPSLIEAELMRKVLEPAKFRTWFHDFAPGLMEKSAKSILTPAVVSDRSDPKIVHLDGLNLSRAWCMFGIASSLPASDPLKSILLTSAKKHADDALAHVASGNYEGEHWLASFAVFMFSQSPAARD
jgi:hypothetical protein